MRISSVHLRNYKRFTDLRIDGIPPSTRLVVMVGPNGSGKSSVFDAFLIKGQTGNSRLTGSIFDGYFLKDETTHFLPSTTSQVAEMVDIELDKDVTSWSRVFSIRSPYRHEADFSNTNLGPVRPAYETNRFQRIIDQDQAVSDNFNRLGRTALHRALRGDPETASLGEFRQDTLGDVTSALESLFDQPTLTLQDLGSGLESGTFRFQKGSAHDFHYKNLSGGEKAAFDLLLDIFVKRHEYSDAIYCIDEPESHVGSAIHGRLLETILDLIPTDSQLWLATHSTGFVRKAAELNQANNNVVFLDFSDRDFENQVVITPAIPNQSFFRKMYDVLQSDLAGLVAPDCVVLCEGSEATDAKMYNAIFQLAHPETLFVARGGASTVEKGDIIVLLEAVVPNVRVWRLIDRDDMPASVRDEKIGQGIRVLRRREIENYLWDKAVVRQALHNIGVEDFVADSILSAYPFQDAELDDMKKDNQQQTFFDLIRNTDDVLLPGRNRGEFMSAHLAPALRETPGVFDELLDDIFGKADK